MEKPNSMRSNRRSHWRLAILVAAVVLAAVAQGASAQGPERPWWETIPGFGHPDDQPQRASDDDPRRRSEVLDDLRTDATPWRSDVMIAAMEGAIERYEAIVSRGGWPTIPGTQPIRPEDNDERVALLYRRLASSGEWTRRPTQNLFGTDYSEGMEEAVRRFQENPAEIRVSGVFGQPPGVQLGGILQFALSGQLPRIHQKRVAGSRCSPEILLRAAGLPACFVLSARGAHRDQHEKSN